MSRFVPRRLIAATLFLTTGLLIASADGPAAHAQGKKDKDKKEKVEKGPGKAGIELRKTFDKLTDVSAALPAGKDAGKVFDHAKRFYRDAVRAVREDDPRRGGELAAAANDAARGLEHFRRATAAPVAGLPEPPADLAAADGPKGKGPPAIDGGPAERGPWTGALDALAVARERLGGDGAPVTGPARDILDAAKGAYSQARTAYEAGDYRKAGEFARAAEAWSHVPEHLTRAGFDAVAAPPAAPDPKRKGAGVPPPPPPIKD